MVVVWAALSFGVTSRIHSRVFRRLFSPLLWESESTYQWTVIKDMGRVPPTYMMAAIIPALIIFGLYFFDHSVMSQWAQQKVLNLKNPSAYHYDILLLRFMVIMIFCSVNPHWLLIVALFRCCSVVY
ncbi:putative bicarbonate transporter [Helianthus debilis subsp. tardiflorus]